MSFFETRLVISLVFKIKRKVQFSVFKFLLDSKFEVLYDLECCA